MGEGAEEGGEELSLAFSRSLPLLALSLSLLFILLLPPLNPPCPARLDADLGSEFAHVLGQGRQAREKSTARFGLKPRHPPEVRSGGRRRRASGSQFAVQVLIALAEEGFNQIFFFFFF